MKLECKVMSLEEELDEPIDPYEDLVDRSDFIQKLEANATNGRENFCYISENKLLAIKELSKRDYEEYKKITQAINKIKKIINDCKKLMPHEFDWEEQADNILEIIEKVSEEK